MVFDKLEFYLKCHKSKIFSCDSSYFKTFSRSKFNLITLWKQ